MIGSVGHHPAAAGRAEHAPGKSAEAVGQKAKAIVAVAREAGADMPRNAQGVAASSIARGVDPASLFAAQVTEGDGETGVKEAPLEVIQNAPVAETMSKSVTWDDPVISEDPVEALFIDEAEADDDTE